MGETTLDRIIERMVYVSQLRYVMERPVVVDAKRA